MKKILIFGMKHHLVDLWQVSSNNTLGAKNGLARGHMFYIGLYREKHEKIFSETTRHRALIFGMWHHLVDLYQVCSNHTPGDKDGPAPGVTRDMTSYLQIVHVLKGCIDALKQLIYIVKA